MKINFGHVMASTSPFTASKKNESQTSQLLQEGYLQQQG
jgi:hypothetical protein